MNSILGYFLIGLPALVMIGCGFYYDCKTTLAALGIASLIILCMGSGFYLLYK